MTSRLRDIVRLSVVVINHDGMGTLPSTIDSLRGYPLSFEEIVVVDDGSSDESTKWLRAIHPDVRLIAFDEHSGNLAKVRNAGLEAVRGTHVFLTDNDIQLFPGCLEAMLAVVEQEERVLCATPRLVYDNRPEVIYQDGNGIHFLALGTGNHRGTPVAEAGVPAPFPTCGGGLMLFNRARLQQVGGFDPGYMHAWGDDNELQLRGRLYGFECLHVPAAVASHHAKDHGSQRASGQIYNRFRVLATFFEVRTLLVLLPSLLLFELALIVGGFAYGFSGAYFAAVRRAWRDRRNTVAARRELQRHRKTPDSQLFWSGPFEIPGVVAPGPGARLFVGVLQRLFDANWRLVRWMDNATRRT